MSQPYQNLTCLPLIKDIQEGNEVQHINQQHFCSQYYQPNSTQMSFKKIAKRNENGVPNKGPILVSLIWDHPENALEILVRSDLIKFFKIKFSPLALRYPLLHRI